jgi:hypothetical protein
MAESVLGWLDSVIDAPVHGAEYLSNAIGVKQPGSSSSSAPAPKKDPPKKEDDKKSTASKALSSGTETRDIEKEISSGPWAKLSQALVKQYDQALAPTEAAVSGSTNATGQADAANQALASLGLSSGSSGAQWLESNLGAANANAAPVSQAMSQYGAQYAAEAGPITKALTAYGQANELEVSTAPEQSWLNALASHITSNLSYYGEVPTSAIGSGITGPIAEALQQSGGYPGSTGSGLTPLSGLTEDSAGNVTVPKASKSTASAALSGGGSVPGTSTNPGA